MITPDSYEPLSDHTVTFDQAKDGSGTLLTNITALCKVTITSRDGGATTGDIVNAQSMTYSGTPGLFTYTVAAALMIANGILRVLVQVYNAGGGTLHYSTASRIIAEW